MLQRHDCGHHLIETRVGCLDRRKVTHNLYKRRQEPEGLDMIFSDTNADLVHTHLDEGKQQEVVHEYKQESPVKITTKYKSGRPLI